MHDAEGEQMLCAQNNYLKTKADGLKCELSIKEAEISNLKTRLEATQRSDHETRSHLEGTVGIIKLISAIKSQNRAQPGILSARLICVHERAKPAQVCEYLTKEKDKTGLNRDLNPGPLAPKARIIPLDH